MRSIAVIGKNYGDEGKGLVTASLSLSCPKALIIKHNGGAQAGHTVESRKTGNRFVHHQTGSGAEYGTPTLFSEKFHPDLYSLGKEITDFKKMFGFTPQIYSEPNAAITTADDVLLNMAAESQRGLNRHGSCGMGIWECCVRSGKGPGFSLSAKDVSDNSEDDIADRLFYLRREHTYKRMAELQISEACHYLPLLTDENVILNFAHEIKNNVGYIEISAAGTEFLSDYDTVIFESGQGLLLSEDNLELIPHVSASMTGIKNPVDFLNKRKLTLDEAIYVSRPYITKHGAGPLPFECQRNELTGVVCDITNRPNEWQGSIRYAKHENTELFLKAVRRDAGFCENPGFCRSLAITHLDETGDRIYFSDKTLTVTELSSVYSGFFDRIYVSRDHESIQLL